MVPGLNSRREDAKRHSTGAQHQSRTPLHQTQNTKHYIGVQFPKGRRAASFNRGATRNPQLLSRNSNYQTLNTKHQTQITLSFQLARSASLATRNPELATRNLYIPLDNAQRSYYKKLHTDLTFHLLSALCLQLNANSTDIEQTKTFRPHCTQAQKINCQ